MNNQNSYQPLFFFVVVISLLMYSFSGPVSGDEPDPGKAVKLMPLQEILTPLETKWIQQHPVIQVAGPKSFPPFYFFDENNRLKGISADYLFYIFEQLGIRVNVHEPLAWSEVLKKIQEGQIDLIACIAKTAERETYLDFSIPYLSFPLVILNRKDSFFIGGIKDLYGKKLAIVNKIVTAEWLRAEGIKYVPVWVESPLKALEAVSFGQADAAIENLAAAGYLIQKHGMTNIKIAAPTPYDNYTLHMAVRKDSPELTGIINKIMQHIPREKHMQIKNKWLSVTYEHGIRKKDVLIWVTGGMGLFCSIIVLVLLWNRKLKQDRFLLQQVKDKLEISEKRFRFFFNSINDAIFLLPFDGKGFAPFLDVNNTACERYGYSLDEFKKLTAFDISLKEDFETHTTSRNRQKLLDRGHLVFETTHVKKSGERIPVEINSNIVELNKEHMILAVVRDISERKISEAEKIRAQKTVMEHEKMALVGRIAGKMAHDFNNILGAILGNAELSLMRCEDEKIRKRLKIILIQTDRGRNLTKNLVVFAKDHELNESYFELNEKIDLVLTLLQKDLEDIRVIKDYNYKIPQLLADPGMIEHALVNIIQNSIHAVSKVEDPRIAIRTYLEQDRLFFQIEDNGCGIAKEHHENIYLPAFTLKGSDDKSDSYRKDIKGTGYGMANVKNYIEKHKGTILFESELNQGTILTIALPVILKELTPSEKKKLEYQVVNKQRKILLVEDEQAISEVQYSILTNAPFFHEVMVANNGKLAIDAFSGGTFDLVSLDYMLPGRINGMDVYHAIREKNKDIPIIFVSGNIDFIESIGDLKSKDSRIDLLSKPCLNMDYINKINAWLA